MDIVIYAFAGLFLLLALGLIFGYYRTRHPGLVLMASCYGTAAVLSVMLVDWWPLVAGFVIAADRLARSQPDRHQTLLCGVPTDVDPHADLLHRRA